MTGSQHTKLNMSILLPLMGLAYMTQNREGVEIVQGAIFSTLFFNPDLDKDNTRPDQNWGILENVWNIYSWLMPHRQLSHKAILGTITRLFFLSIPICVIWYISSIYHDYTIQLDDIFRRKYIVLGIFVGDWLHLLGDSLTERGLPEQKFDWTIIILFLIIVLVAASIR